MTHRLFFVCYLIASALGVAAPPPDYNRDVRPILSEKCFHCHGPDDKHRYAGLRLDTAEGATHLRSGRAAVIPGKPEESELIRRVSLTAAPRRMPMNKEALTAREIDVLRQWIAAGARYDEHWAYRAPVRPSEPKLRQHAAWAATPIDRFILARLEQTGLGPAPPSERAALLRRVTLDLTGLPPTLSEIDAFLIDKDPRAYERVVDRLLASPHFGERWARHWLDLARYAESSGYQHDDLRPMWPYRDWVVRAFNSDMPFSQFTIEQLAGDLLPNPTTDQLVATAFHRNSNTNLGGDITEEESRHNVRIDRVNTTGMVWLASTIGCAQCHTHKYDPIRIDDYYRMYAYFHRAADEVMQEVGTGSQRKHYTGAILSLPVPPVQQRKFDEAAKAYEQASNATKDLEKKLAANLPQWEASLPANPKVPGNIAKILQAPVHQRAELHNERLLAFYLGTLPEVKSQRAVEKKALAAMEAAQPPQCLVMRERPEPPVTTILLRGNLATPGAAVEPGPPIALGPTIDNLPPNRLGLAQWLVDKRHPLTARVAMNRVWAEIFGTGIVITTEDFGRQGEPPSHPELLDWLAVEFMDHNWSMKHMIRLMVTSAAYRQASAATPDLLAKDPANRLLSRGPRFRLDAEAIRDVTLSASGLLSPVTGGPSVFPPQPANLWKEIAGAEVSDYFESKGSDRYRRGIYTVWRRGNPYPAFLNFDAATRMECTARRVRTNTPLQALTLLNDPVFVEAADALAARLKRDLPNATIEQRIAHGFRLCTGRPPKSTELAILLDLHARTLERYGVAGDKAETAAWRSVARALLNLDETITKG